MKILLFGLPGTGKTTLALKWLKALPKNTVHLNGDLTRAVLNSDLDFSIQGRLEHARRLGNLATYLSLMGHYVLTDFVCPLDEMRDLYKADVSVWMDTKQTSKYSDTNAMFQPPSEIDFQVTTWTATPSLETVLELGHKRHAARQIADVPVYSVWQEKQKRCWDE